MAEQTCESKAVSPDVLARVGLRSADAALSRARAHELLASFQALRHSLANALVSSRASSVAPEKLEEIDGAFRAFDTDGSNTLSYDELTGALGSLGIESEVSHSLPGFLIRPGASCVTHTCAKEEPVCAGGALRHEICRSIISQNHVADLPARACRILMKSGRAWPMSRTSSRTSGS